MDAAEETIQGFRPEKRPRVDDKTPLRSPTQAVAVTKVLDDENLLREIIVRVGLPTTLVCAALVCKRWLGHASDPKFLIRFRELHPPRLLSYYITGEYIMSQRPWAARFVPMLPQPLELAAVIRRLESYNFGAHEIIHCQNDSVFTMHPEVPRSTHGVHRPLCPERHTQIFPPLPRTQDHNPEMFSEIFSIAEGSSMSYMYVLGEFTKARESTTHVYMLQDGEWRKRTSATCPQGLQLPRVAVYSGHNRIYFPSTISDDIIFLDLMASSFSSIQLPLGVKYRFRKSMLSRADDASSVYLINVKAFQLCIWLHKGENWLLVDTICLHEMLANLGMSGHTLENGGFANVFICQVGDNGQFVILRMDECIFYLDIKCRTLCKLYEKKGNDPVFCSIDPFMMIWPPTFPAIKDDPARNAMSR